MLPAPGSSLSVCGSSWPSVLFSLSAPHARSFALSTPVLPWSPCLFPYSPSSNRLVIISPVQPTELMRRIKSRQGAPERSPLWSLLWRHEFQWSPRFTEACDHKRIPLESWVGWRTGEDEQEECELEASLGSTVTSWREGRRERGEETEAVRDSGAQGSGFWKWRFLSTAAIWECCAAFSRGLWCAQSS